MNTTRKGSVRCIVFKEDDTWYGVALEFNIVVSGDDFDVVMFSLNEALRGYVTSLKKASIEQTQALNQRADEEYESLWRKLHSDEPIPSPYQIGYFGVACV